VLSNLAGCGRMRLCRIVRVSEAGESVESESEVGP